MTNRELLEGALQSLPEHRVQEVLDFVRFLGFQEERESWREFGRRQLARAYSDDEPEYTVDDIKPALQP
jgi:hypothetical protein